MMLIIEIFLKEFPNAEVQCIVLVLFDFLDI